MNDNDSISSQESSNLNPEEKLIQLQSLVQEEDNQQLTEFLEPQTGAEIANLLDSFPAKDKEQIWQDVPDNLKGEVLAESGDETRQTIMSAMDTTAVSNLTKDLDAQNITEILENIGDSVKSDVIENLDGNTRTQVETLQSYDDNSIGRYMKLDTINVREDVNLETVQRFIRINGLLNKQFREIMVINKDNQLVGALDLTDLVKQNQDALVSEFMSQPISLLDTLNIHEASTTLRSHSLHFAPVINESNQLLGQLTIDDT